MTTSPNQSLISEIFDGGSLEPFHLGYFRERMRNRIHEEVLQTFLEKQRDCGFSRAVLARRLKKRPEQVTRWFAGPGNWTLDTVSDLLLAMGSELSFTAVDLSEMKNTPKNHYHEMASQPASFRAPSSIYIDYGSLQPGTVRATAARSVDVRVNRAD